MLDNYIEILQQYKNPKLQYLFSSLPLPNQWQLFQTANKIDVLNSQTDYLIDLYHYREIPKLLLKDQIERLPEEFQHDLNQEEFILMLARVLEFPPSHLPFLINGTRILYDQICWLNQIHKVNFSTFLSFYIICESEAKDMPESFLPYTNDQRAFLKHFQEFEKDDFGFRFSKNQDITHHQNPIKKVFYCQDSIFSLDQMSDNIQIFDSETIELKKTISCTSTKHKTNFLGSLSKTISQKTINILDIFFADSPKILGACCQDKTISFWTLTNKFQQEYSFSTEKYGLQVQIAYLESIKAWITINRENQIYQWSFTQLIESNDSKAISFANSSVGTAVLLPYKGAQINYIKEISLLNQLFICTTEEIQKKSDNTDKIFKTIEKRIHVWNPIKWHAFSDIKLPNKGSSVHTITYSPKLDVLFTVGFNDDVLLWKFDEGNENYNQFHKLTIREQIENQRIENNTVSAIEAFDEYGMLISLDNKGIMRCWDIESWEIIYRFNLECEIINTISQILKLNQGKFIVTTQRLKVLQFPRSQPRKVKVRFKPRLMQCFSQRVYVSSNNQLIGFNWNNAYIEEKVEMANEQEKVDSGIEILFFFTHWDVTIIITNDAILHIIKDRFRNNQKGKKDFLEYPLFENKQIEGCQFHYLYSQLTCWNKSILRIFQSQYISKQLHFTKIREMDARGHIQKVVNCCERDIIGVLMKNNILNFIQYSTMKTTSSVTTEDEIADFFLFNDYRCLAIIHQKRIVFYSHQDYALFQPKYFVRTDSISHILNLNYESLDKILDIYVPNHFKYKNIQFFKQQEANNQFKYNEDVKKDFSVLQQIKELKQKNEECNFLEVKGTGLVKFKRTVKKILDMIRKNSLDELHRISILERQSIIDSSNQPSQILDLDSTLIRRNGQYISNIKIDYELQPVDLNQYTYSKVYIYEDFHYQYFLCQNSNPIVLSNIQSKIVEKFQQIKDPYLNKDDNTKIIVSFNSSDEIFLDYKEAEEVILTKVEIDHNSINPQIINFYDHLLLITFGKEDNALKFWDVTCLKSLKQLIVDKEYLNLKPSQVSSILKLKELQEYNQTHEIKSQEQMVSQKTKDLQSLIKYKTKHLGSTNLGDSPYLQAEYILPLELRLKWNLKDFNSLYRINQMKETFNYMLKMLYNYQEANKYQIYQQQLQINNKMMLQQKIKSGSQLDLYFSDDLHDHPQLPKLYLTQLQIKPDPPPNTPFPKVSKVDKKADINFQVISSILRKSDSDQQDQNNTEKKLRMSVHLSPKGKIKKLNKKKEKDKDSGRENQKEKERDQNKEKEYYDEGLKQKTDDQVQYERFDQFIKGAPKKIVQLNKQLNELYYPPFEKEQKLLEIEKRKQRQKPDLQVTTNKKTGIQLIKFSHRATDEEKRKFLMNYSFEEVAIKQSQSLREISAKHVDKSLTPFKDYLKETRSIKLNNPIKAKVKLSLLKQNDNVSDILDTNQTMEDQVKEEMVGLKLIKRNHRAKIKDELKYILDADLKKFSSQDSFAEAINDSQRNRSLTPLKEYLISKSKSKKQLY
ncbi:unnamed protein product (macronuclear) [Paramecium tetraurelia]|uniref:Uncharacterized protein n=1 Tax=Paramecium tetraurelia TaxID=5888 RepID=A0E4B5_PARTE|nr:uncharacterized protein GSPATT00023306001 [Paramecium tetraurelia]CAK90132.1 unnamed protein product [Paramecium tetraurelia]|eukprot:XP_001457529.1 hypothetical protein (macronuclear) [Paramecium tetraurelia strain d4-2]